MPEPLGNLCLVLHGHLPYVLNHGHQPHGETWLFEAAAEVYLPLLDVIGETSLHRAKPALTIGLTPVVLEQLAHERFKTGFVAYLNERLDRSEQDRRDFETRGDAHGAFLAERWGKWFARALESFERIGRDIPGQFAARWREDQIELLTSSATHAYLPLLLNDNSIRAQLAAGVATSERHLGRRPAGVWLPECGYRPAETHWQPPVLFHDTRYRIGLERLMQPFGLDHFFIDQPLVAGSKPVGLFRNDEFVTIGEAELYWDAKRGWRSPLDPVGVVSDLHQPEVFAFARETKVCEQVWSRATGYPGSGEYLDFHHRHGEHGLRYRRVTSHTTDLGDKRPYDPDDTFSKLFEHTTHFCSVIKDALRGHKERTGHLGTVVAAFDAELFGHWWFEGPNFLRDVIFTLNRDPEVNLCTTAKVLEDRVPEKVVRLPKGSWGEGNDDRVWLNDRTRWMWETEYRAENRLNKALAGLPWRKNAAVATILQRAARELLLLQGSDWPFVVHSGGAVDYGYSRFASHATRFDEAITAAGDVAAERTLNSLREIQLKAIDAHDSGVFEKIDLGWWL